MIYFFSYGDDKYKKAKRRIKKEAKKFGFDDVKVYGRSDISPYFLEKTKPYIDMPKGGGYWLWKSFFIKKTFHKMDDGDICIYADAGCHINIHGKKRLNYYLELLKLNSSGILSFALSHTETEFTNEKVFDFFDIDKKSDVRRSSQYMSTILYMKKCQNTINIVNEYYDIAINHGDLFTDIHNDYNRAPLFKDHRHDQSIFSLLRKKHCSIVMPDETYAIDWNDLVDVPILATRIRG